MSGIPGDYTERMRHSARETGELSVIEWVEAVIGYDKTRFSLWTGTASTDDMKRAEQRKRTAHQALTPDQRSLAFLEDDGAIHDAAADDGCQVD